MPMRMKVNGAWTGAIASGNFRVRSGGAWIYPAYCRMRVNGAWVDTGYVGYPSAPVNLWVHAWSYSAIALNWTLGSGGAPVSAVNLVKTDPAGNWLNQVEVGAGGPWGNFNMSWDTRYRFYIRAKGASGLYSGFYGPLNVSCGHPRQDTYGYVLRERAWQSDVIGGWFNKDQACWIYVAGAGDGRAGDILIQGLHSRNWRTPQSGTVSGTASRTLNHIYNNGDFGSVGTVGGGWGEDLGLNNWSSNSYWGYVPRGTGWSTTGNQYYQAGVDQVWLTGTERYNNYEIVSTIAEQGNGYW